MARGFISGVIWGTVVVGAGAAGLSLAYPEFKPSKPVPMAQTDGAVMSPEAPAPATPETAAPAQMETNTASEMEAGAEATPPAADMDAQPEAVLQPEPAVAPVAHTPEQSSEQDMPAPVQDADQPDADESTQNEMAEPVATETEDTPLSTAPAESAPADTDDTAMTPTEEPAGQAETAMTAETDMAEPETEESSSAADEPAPTGESKGGLVGALEAVTDEIARSANAAKTEDNAIEAPEVKPEPQTAPEAEADGQQTEAVTPKPEGTVGNLAEGVTTNRLPSVGSDQDTSDAEMAETGPRPIEAFAEDYTAEEGKPLMSIVLMEDGKGALGLEALESFPYPLTFAVDARAPDAQDRMKAYREKGFEVVAMVGLPEGATPQDAEVSMQVYLSAVPEAVAILEEPGASLQSSRDVSEQITSIVQASGHGLILQSSGLNTAQKLAKRDGVPAETVFRDFDGNDQNASVIRRFLDQAAFKARQEGGVIMLGRLRAETISALLIWGLADRASRVALVPVSAVLTASQNEG